MTVSSSSGLISEIKRKLILEIKLCARKFIEEFKKYIFSIETYQMSSNINKRILNIK